MCFIPADNDWVIRKLAKEAADPESDFTLADIAELSYEDITRIQSLAPDIALWLVTEAEEDTDAGGGDDE